MPDAIAAIRTRIDRAAHDCGRDPASVDLVAVSKFHPRQAVDAALGAGQRRFGENRVQEADGKFGAASARTDGAILHVIGALQTNKARDAVRIADVIEVLDRTRLAEAIEDAAAREGRLPRLLVQVNTGDESQKAGVSPADAERFIADCRRRFGAALTGLMCIPPAGDDPAPHFERLGLLASRHGLATLSMGMSGDFETAIRHGATSVRVGTAIFGARPAPDPAARAA